MMVPTTWVGVSNIARPFDFFVCRTSPLTRTRPTRQHGSGPARRRAVDESRTVNYCVIADVRPLRKIWPDVAMSARSAQADRRSRLLRVATGEFGKHRVVGGQLRVVVA